MPDDPRDKAGRLGEELVRIEEDRALDLANARIVRADGDFVKLARKELFKFGPEPADPKETRTLADAARRYRVAHRSPRGVERVSMSPRGTPCRARASPPPSVARRGSVMRRATRLVVGD